MVYKTSFSFSTNNPLNYMNIKCGNFSDTIYYPYGNEILINSSLTNYDGDIRFTMSESHTNAYSGSIAGTPEVTVWDYGEDFYISGKGYRPTNVPTIINSETLISKNYTYPASAVYLSDECYCNCQNIISVDLKNIPWTNNSVDWAFSNCRNLKYVNNLNENITSMYGTFDVCINLASAPIIPNSVTNMAHTFWSCQQLTEPPVIPEGVTNMSYTFGGCGNLKNAPVIPEGVTNMDMTFYYCFALENAPVINHLNNLTNMKMAFYQCIKLTSVPSMPNNVTDISSAYGACNLITEPPTIPNSVTNMFGLFQECTNLLNVPVIPNSVTNIDRAFYGCQKIVNAPIIPNTITSLTNTFSSCFSLQEFPIIPNSVSIMDNSFTYCKNLTTISNLPYSITNLYNTFGNCQNITGNIYIHSNQIVNAVNCFGNTSLQKNVFIPFYSNNEHTTTYNSFIAAGYDEIGTTSGVYLKDLNQLYGVDTNDYTITQRSLVNYYCWKDPGYMAGPEYVYTSVDVNSITPNITPVFEINSTNISNITFYEYPSDLNTSNNTMFISDFGGGTWYERYSNGDLSSDGIAYQRLSGWVDDVNNINVYTYNVDPMLGGNVYNLNNNALTYLGHGYAYYNAELEWEVLDMDGITYYRENTLDTSLDITPSGGNSIIYLNRYIGSNTSVTVPWSK